MFHGQLGALRFSHSFEDSITSNKSRAVTRCKGKLSQLGTRIYQPETCYQIINSRMSQEINLKFRVENTNYNKSIHDLTHITHFQDYSTSYMLTLWIELLYLVLFERLLIGTI